MKKRYKILLGILGGVIIFWAGGWTQEKFNRGADLFNQPHLQEGLKRYAPTRMEWLALVLDQRNIFTDPEAWNMSVVYSHYGARLDVTLTYKYGLTDKKVKELIQGVKRKIISVAKEYGWDTWVPVQLSVERSLFEKVGNMYYPRDRAPVKTYEWAGHEEPKLIMSY